jgi:hypothetical protein
MPPAALRLALLTAIAAALRLVGEAALRIPGLVFRGVNELLATVHANNCLVFEGHDQILG